MKLYIKSLLLAVVIFFSSCTQLVDGINENPNDILITDIDAELFLTGAMLANSVAQGGHLNRIAGMYSGQLIGITSLYSNIYGFALSTAESVATWSRIYVGCVANLRHIRNSAPEDQLLQGICKVIEAHAIGTAASLFGDVPYSEISNLDISDPKFDDQVAVFAAVIALLDQGISDLNAASTRVLSQDIYFEGDADKWIAAANTLKARYYLQQKDYASAYTAAQNGISSDEGSMKFIPRGDGNISEGDKNLFWQILEGSRTGDIGTGNSFLMQLLDPANGESRNNAKTDESARFGYYRVDETGGSINKGIIEQYEPQNLVSYAENQLILAECGARNNGLETGLGHLNDLRAWLNTGDMVNENFVDSTFLYEAYVASDFDNGGIENPDGIESTRALLREIIEERYISGFGMFIPYNDARRLRKSDSDIAVPFVMVDGPSPPYPERMPYSDDELNSNGNAPAEDPGIFTKTKVNQ
ncbi:MAG: SusD/RagB family nutrient-binding outer membrane lipoprotein [Bacteroidota bacterium]